MATHEFVAYIDESGDDGLSGFRAVGKSGSSNWLVLAACLVRRENDLSLVKSRDALLAGFSKTQTREIHFQKLRHEQKTVVCQTMAKMPIRVSNVICCKAHIPEDNTYGHTHNLYWYLCRYLMERISWFCHVNRKTKTPIARIVFSNKGGMKYSQFEAYMKILKAKGNKTSINWASIDLEQIEVHPSSRYAGLQFADASAGAFAAGVEPNHFGNTEASYAKALKPIVYRKKKNYWSYGAKFVCTTEKLQPAQKEFREIFA